MKTLHLHSPSTPAELAAYYDLRWRVLRAPWDQPRGSERDELDDDPGETFVAHLAAWDEAGRILGVGRLHFNGPTEVQIRFMAVEEDFQGQGIGRAMVARLESLAYGQGASTVILNARSEAVGFYERLGYTVVAQGEAMFGDSPAGPVEHARMAKVR